MYKSTSFDKNKDLAHIIILYVHLIGWADTTLSIGAMNLTEKASHCLHAIQSLA